jgi:hypothetical protein
MPNADNNKLGADAANKGMVNLDDLPADALLVQVSKEMKIALRDYFSEKRPFEEVDYMLNTVFSDAQIDMMWTEEGFTTIVDYLKKCPHKEVKGFIAKLPHETKVFSKQPANPTDKVSA